MGQVINLNSWEQGLPDALTQTGQGGFLSRGYLAEQPAIALVKDDETVQYVLTNRKRGVTVKSGGSTDRIKPDGRHRTVTVVTDRRLLILVGRGDGDERTIMDLAEITDVEVTAGRRSGRLTFTGTDDTTWELSAATDGLDAVADYLQDGAKAWRRVDTLLETVERDLSDAVSLRQAGEYERALSTARATHADLETARSIAIQFSTDHPGNALHSRPQNLAARRRAVIAEIRVERARDAARTGQELFREGNYDAALEAYERAREAYDSALTVGAESEELCTERAHVDEIVTGLRESSVRRGITADRAAVAADDPRDAADHWEAALDHYRTAIETDDALFEGDPDRIRDRIRTVAESLTASHRAVADEAIRAGDWYVDAEQYEAALTEFETAAEAFEAALATAAESYPDAVTHLEADREALDQRIERARAGLAGERPTGDRIQSGDEPAYDISASIGDVSGPSDIEAAIEPPLSESSRDTERLPESTAGRLRSLDRTTASELITDALDATDWATQKGSPRMPFDFIATRDGERMGVLVRTTESEVTVGTVENCADVTGAAGTDAVLLATTGTVPDPVDRRAAELGVRVIGCESLAAIVDTESLSVPVSKH